MLEEMSANGYQWSTERTATKKSFGIHKVDVLIALIAQLPTLSNQISAMSANAIHSIPTMCDLCNGGRYASTECSVGNYLAQSQPEQANYVGIFNRNQNDLLSNTYNQG